MDKENFKIDLIKCTKEVYFQFAEKVVKDKLKNIFDYYINKMIIKKKMLLI